MITDNIGKVITGLTLAGVLAVFTLYSQVQVIQTKQDTMELRVMDKDLIDARIRNIETDISEIKEEQKAAKIRDERLYEAVINIKSK